MNRYNYWRQFASATYSDSSKLPYAQWTLSGSSNVVMTVRSSGKSVCIEGDRVWSGENILVGSVGSKSKEFRFLEPEKYVPTTGVSIQKVYLLKNGGYICMPQIEPATATFRRVIWSWESRGSTADTGITMTNYNWGTSTASYTGTVVKGLKEGTYWLRAYCSDTNYENTKDVNVHFLESGPYYFKNRESNKYMSVEGHSQADGAQIIQESFKGEVWQEFYLNRDFLTGYITIKNRHSGKYLSVLNNSGAHDTDIKQDPLPTAGNISSAETGQQFKIERISGEDTIKIIPRTGEGYTPQRVVCVANYVTNSDGVHVKQRDFGANDGYYRDEWYAYKLDRSSAFGELIVNMQQLYELAKEYSELQHSLMPDSAEMNPAELTTQYIRRLAYNSDYDDGFNKWYYAAGPICQPFVDYVNTENSNLSNYFNHDEDWIINALNNQKFEINHLAATYNILLYDSATPWFYEDDVDDLGGWGGDLRQSVPYIMSEVNYSNDYDTVYNATYNYIGNGSYFNQADLLADVDAYNLYNMEGEKTDSPAERFLVYYYGGKYLNRFTDFIGEQKYADIYDRSECMITMAELDIIWPIKNVDTGEDLILTDIQIEAICDAYTTYIIDQTINE